MIKFKKQNIRRSSRISLKTNQKIYMILGLTISTLASIALFTNAQNASEREQFWVTTKPIAAGQSIDEESVDIMKFDLGELEKNYLNSETVVFGKTALQPIPTGNLLKPENVGIKSNLRNVAIRISNGHLPPSLQMNDWVDIWFSDPISLSTSLIIPKISVVWIDEVDSNFGGVTTVVVAVPEANVLQLVNSARSDGIDLVQREN
jgi:hypothetical protein